MARGYVLGLAVVLQLGCGKPVQKQSEASDVSISTQEQAFYRKYPFYHVEGLKSNVGPAPFGDAKVVAEAAIRYSEHPCPSVTRAVRNEVDGSVTAKCSNGERYNVFRMDAIKEPIALKCSAWKKLMGREPETCGTI